MASQAVPVDNIENIAHPQAQPKSRAFSLFPPLPERLEALQTEIKEILPKQSTAITNTESFATFRKHLLTIPPSPNPLPKNPTLLPSDLQ
jgi:hypothetical protein